LSTTAYVYDTFLVSVISDAGEEALEVWTETGMREVEGGGGAKGGGGATGEGGACLCVITISSYM
jgi:hypothetical protein